MSPSTVCAKRGLKKRVFALGLPALGAICLPGCVESDGASGDLPPAATTGCSDASCRDGVRVSLVSGGVFPAGQYELVSVFEGGGRACGFEVGGSVEVCGFDVPCLLADTCEADWNFFGVPHSISILVAPETPVELDVELRRNQAVVAGAHLVPEYRTLAPAGIDCEPQCRVAEAVVDVE